MIIKDFFISVLALLGNLAVSLRSYINLLLAFIIPLRSSTTLNISFYTRQIVSLHHPSA